jgi:lipid II:glycine glycyltransferase (peptidoglycan interpeptide bridge formation enzyme)
MTMDAWLEADAARWDAFVETARYRSFSQLWAWGELRRDAGWEPFRLALGRRDAREICAGAQLMVRRVPGIGAGLAYVPRGPVGELDDDTTWFELVAAMRRLAERERVATIRLEPEAPIDSPLAARLAPGVWRPAPAVQPVATRYVDLTRDEDALRGDLRRKHRQYIGKAERAGITVERFDATASPDVLAAALADFHAILAGTGDRAGFNTRPATYYRRAWDALAAGNRARLFFATRDGQRLATLFHIACGDQIAELYGGSTPDGTRERANYLVKWEAMLALRAEGFTRYDLWGLPTEGIAQFKEGFGGTQVTLVGGRDLPIRRGGDLAVRAALMARDRYAGWRDARHHARARRITLPEGFREATGADADAWQALLEAVPSGDVLHDWAWADVAAFDGEPQRRYVVEEDGRITALCAAQVRRTSMGRSFWYVPRGPVLDYAEPHAADRLGRVLEGLRRAATADRAIAVRIEPRLERDSRAAALFEDAGLRRVAATLQTPNTRLVDLLPDDEALLATFDKDTRYAIRRAAREGVETSVTGDPDDDEALSELHGIVTETLDRARYRLPSLDRYRIAWRGLAAAGRARIVRARYDGALESAGLLVVEGDRSIYLYSGSIREAKGETKRFASYAAQWRMMLTAREMGARVHDLWGVAPAEAGPEHPWYGYSLFKKGFGGRFVSWAGSWDLVVDPVMYGLRGLASVLRGFGPR